jgi:hypothetical protein
VFVPPGRYLYPMQLRNGVKSTGLMILVAGPYRSGTGDDPAKLAANMDAMEACALPLFRAGHIQIVGDAAFHEIFHPIAERLLERCDGVLRVGGASDGADQMARAARERGLAVFFSLAEIPAASSG